jgi:hypothetical protein
MEVREANKVLKVRVLADLLDCLLIAKAQLVLDNHRPDDKPATSQILSQNRQTSADWGNGYCAWCKLFIWLLGNSLHYI